jgi:hypothetical protein
MKKHLSIGSHNAVNKENIAKSISIIFDSKNAMPDYIKKMLLERLLWATTEHDNNGIYKKYEGQPYWSKGALRKLILNIAEKKKNPKLSPYQDLRHEHSIPKKIIRELTLVNDITNEQAFEILNNFGHAVVISKDEDKLLNQKILRSKLTMPLDEIKNLSDVFSRYKKAEIQICDVRNLNIFQLTPTEIDNLVSLT